MEVSFGQEADAEAVLVFDPPAESQAELSGKKGDAVLLRVDGRRLVATGAGKRDDIDADGLRTTAAAAAQALVRVGGSLRWPWVLFAVSLLAWLLYDAILMIPVLLGISDTPFLPASEVVRVLAGTSAVAAGLAQRRAGHEIECNDRHPR